MPTYSPTVFLSFGKHRIAEPASVNVGDQVADLDNDGDLDIIASTYTNGNVAWLENVGSYSFSSHGYDGDAEMTTDAAVADVNGDADMDVLVTYWLWGSDDTDGSVTGGVDDDASTPLPPEATNSLDARRGESGIYRCRGTRTSA